MSYKNGVAIELADLKRRVEYLESQVPTGMGTFSAIIDPGREPSSVTVEDPRVSTGSIITVTEFDGAEDLRFNIKVIIESGKFTVRILPCLATPAGPPRPYLVRFIYIIHIPMNKGIRLGQVV